MLPIIKKIQRKISSLRYRLLHKADVIRDSFLGVDFTKPVNKEVAGIDNNAENVYFDSTSFAPELNKALQIVNINNTDAILDYGCGKGGALYKFSGYPFKDIAGVDLSKYLTDIAIKNFKKLKKEYINVYCEDATTFTNIDQYNYFYFANPFTGKIFDKVLQNILNSNQRVKRKITIIYFNPQCYQAIENTSQFTVVKKLYYGYRKLYIYQLN